MCGAEEIEYALGDIAASRYDRIEIGIEKIQSSGPENLGR